MHNPDLVPKKGRKKRNRELRICHYHQITGNLFHYLHCKLIIWQDQFEGQFEFLQTIRKRNQIKLETTMKVKEEQHKIQYKDVENWDI